MADMQLLKELGLEPSNAYDQHDFRCNGTQVIIKRAINGKYDGISRLYEGVQMVGAYLVGTSIPWLVQTYNTNGKFDLEVLAGMGVGLGITILGSSLWGRRKRKRLVNIAKGLTERYVDNDVSARNWL